MVWKFNYMTISKRRYYRQHISICNFKCYLAILSWLYVYFKSTIILKYPWEESESVRKPYNWTIHYFFISAGCIKAPYCIYFTILTVMQCAWFIRLAADRLPPDCCENRQSPERRALDSGKGGEYCPFRPQPALKPNWHSKHLSCPRMSAHACLHGSDATGHIALNTLRRESVVC